MDFATVFALKPGGAAGLLQQDHLASLLRESPIAKSQDARDAAETGLRRDDLLRTGQQ